MAISRPVSSAARDGVQMGAAAYIWVNRTPAAAIPSITGVRTAVLP